MSVFDQVRVIIYRFHEKGLEIFLENTGLEEENWTIPFTDIAKYKNQIIKDELSAIELDPVEGDTDRRQTLAIEGDWHDIPSIRKLVKQDVKLVASKMQYIAPEIENGAYFAVKETVKKVLPHEYEMLKELKDIVTHRNLLKNL